MAAIITRKLLNLLGNQLAIYGNRISSKLTYLEALSTNQDRKYVRNLAVMTSAI
ncbi:hypothetical protein Riv7116_6110 [Rivularia sp. PCC 7116]|uniref:hypothetical protein n=1 Tax=Rivularia sp. PCC 7116 TaxID=373994 RepID=UPI00029EDFC5|nr:hypothetical protein [Rivularia sp. PCC 7116]AFY58466.1 hypothetical protein Riv7116_6110 [Rivularia sp. PCC 7116]